MNGQTEFARRSLEFFLKMCNKQGFITTGYTLVGTGEVLWTLGEHYERTRDRAWMKKVAPDVVRICQWVIRQREKTKRLDARGQKVPEYGLMPPGVTADWNRYAYRFFNEPSTMRDLKSAGQALADIGDPAAPAILEDAKQYREDIVRAYRWTQARMPVVPLGQRHLGAGRSVVLGLLRPRRGFPARRRRQPNLVLQHRSRRAPSGGQ